MTFDVPMDNAQVVHVEVHSGAVEGNFHSLGERKVDIALHVEHVEQTVVYELVNDHDVGDRRNTSHQQGNGWVTQNALHHDFVLDFSKQFIRDVGVKNFLDSYRSTVEQSFVDNREATLADLLSNLDIRCGDLAHSWYLRKSTRCR